MFLARRSYLVITFDFRAHGNSEGSKTSLGYHEQKDVSAALHYLSSRNEVDLDRIGIFGFSLGGSTAILSAAETRKFRAVATTVLSPVYGTRPVRRSPVTIISPRSPLSISQFWATNSIFRRW